MSHDQPNAMPPGGDAWENEGGSIAPQKFAESPGVVRHLTEIYPVGGFQYTNLPDAIAQPRRMASLRQAIR